jgi:hypothetical protein
MAKVKAILVAIKDKFLALSPKVQGIIIGAIAVEILHLVF